MNLEYFIAKRVALSGSKSFSVVIIRIAIAAIALSMTVMICSTSLINGFKNEISDKIFGFWGHIHISRFDSHNSFEAKPISIHQNFYPHLDTIQSIQYQTPFQFLGMGVEGFDIEKETKGGIQHIQAYANKKGIIKTKKDFEGIILKGVSAEYDWNFLQKYLIDGQVLAYPDSSSSREILVSKRTAERLKLKVGDRFMVHFVKNSAQLKRRLTVSGIYNTGLDEYDRKFALVDIRMIQELNGWNEDEVSGFEVLIDDLDDLDAYGDYIYYNEIGSELYAKTVREFDPVIFGWLDLQNVNETVILLLMILVSIFNMATALMILILERTNMIGTIKALGARNWSVQKMFLYYAAYIIGIGLLLGNILGLGLCWLQDYFGFVTLDEQSYYVAVAPIYINWGMILFLNLLTMFTTLLILIVPSYLIAKITPIKAIRFK